MPDGRLDGGELDVTVVVCAHDRLDLTRRCLTALRDTAPCHTATFEVVLVDDASWVATSDRVGVEFPDVRVLRLDTQGGYVRAANAGIRAARGRHVLLLNNDTVPIGAWLDPLLDTLTRRGGAGLVGSRLPFPDGRLQEAGATVYSDGSVRHYLREQDGLDPRAGFEREVDYCSGASLLVRPLDRVGARLLGTVLNFVPTKKRGYGGYGYGYYGYGHDQAADEGKHRRSRRGSRTEGAADAAGPGADVAPGTASGVTVLAAGNQPAVEPGTSSAGADEPVKRPAAGSDAGHAPPPADAQAEPLPPPGPSSASDAPSGDGPRMDDTAPQPVVRAGTVPGERSSDTVLPGT